VRQALTSVGDKNSQISLSRGVVLSQSTFHLVIALAYYKFTAKFVGERILKIGQYMAKLVTKIYWHLFLDMVYIKMFVHVSD